MKNDFISDLDFSNNQKLFWQKVYKMAFPVMLSIVDMSNNMEAQRVGIDTIIKLPFGAELAIDEKIRRKNYGDVLLEFISNDQKNTKGWIEKELKIDCIAYAFIESKIVYFFYFPDLQKLWFLNKQVWMNKYKPPKVAKNKFYNTISLAIPFHELKSLRILKVNLNDQNDKAV